MTHLFIFTIGPVQSFIASARKTQDLFAGSKLLSYLCFCAAEQAVKEGGKIITPYIPPEYFKGKPFGLSLPNVLVARFENALDIENIGIRITEAVKTEFKTIANRAKKNIAFPAFDAQIENHLDILWLFEEMKDENDYHDAYKLLTSHLASIKNLRVFSQFNYQANSNNPANQLFGERGRKCNVDGERNIVAYRKLKNEKPSFLTNKVFLNHTEFCEVGYKNESVFEVWLIQQGEGLSAVTLAKRNYLGDPHQFPSTARVALWNWHQAAQQLAEYSEFKKHIESWPGITEAQRKEFLWFYHSNDEMYFEENITKARFDKEGYFKGQEFTKEGQPAKILNGTPIPTADEFIHWSRSDGSPEDGPLQLHKKMLDSATTAGIDTKRSKYYALVSSDGDEMGKILSGEYRQTNKTNMNYHQKLTKALGAFSDGNIENITPPHGKTIYAGGEDFMGFFNLHHLLDELNLLNCRYGDVDNEMRNEHKAEKRMTISTGVVIAHYKEPLSQLVKISLVLEKQVKRAGRDRFAISVMKRSSEDATCIYPWIALPYLKYIIIQLQSNFSNTFLIALLDIFDEFGQQSLTGFLEAEMKRLITRSKRPTTDKSEIEKLYSRLFFLWNIQWHDMPQINEEKHVENFTSMLKICDFIARETGFVNQIIPATP
jgi:CRISPR-associated protein Cmr2